MAGDESITRRTVLAGMTAASVCMLLPVPPSMASQTPSSALAPSLAELDRALSRQLAEFRVLRTAELHRVWQRRLSGLDAYDMAARTYADERTGMTAAAKRILAASATTLEETAIMERASEALVEYAMPCPDWHLVVRVAQGRSYSA